MKVEFSKKGFNFAVVVNGTECILEHDGVKVEVDPVKRSRSEHGRVWGYEIEGGKITEKLTGKKKSLILTHDSAEEAAKLIKEFKIKKEKEKILNSEIQLKYYYGDWYRVNAVWIGDDILDFGNVGNLFSDERLRDLLGNFPNRKKIEKKLDKYIRGLFEDILFENTDQELKLSGVRFEYKEYDDLRGRGRYVSNVIFEDFEVFEKYVLEAFEEEIVNKKENDEEIEKIFEEARKTGKPQLLERRSVTCNNPNEECDIDIITTYALPNGKTETERNHTW